MADLFRKPKRKIQKRKIDQDEEEIDEQESNRVADIRDLQRSRERKNGLTELECAVGITKAAALEDGIQMTGGGMMMTAKKKAAMEAASIEHGLRDQFEKETMLRDEHEELRKYIDDGLTHYTKDTSTPSQPRGEKQPAASASSRFSSLNADDRDVELLKEAAGKLKANQSKKETELLSEHMLAGIPEVDLGISTRITNILETEKKKRFLMQKSAAEAAGLPVPVEETDDGKKKHHRRRNFNNHHHRQ
ncbi:hypothetical protein B9Z55_000212 [Caenorhabditis nigoni]|uniref:Uncharacterized protein n=1 Tax=Caenorhabditis nigoni TaxID=1611254 RepID=A0A2G5VIX5_9PELO|nr:hypothetical protein B9Z55_000212 [Caenorhabditis nigoni]